MVNAACVRGGVIARQMFIRPCTWDKLISLFNDSGKHATLTDAGPRRERMAKSRRQTEKEKECANGLRVNFPW